MKKKKGLLNFLKSLDGILFLFGILSNLGIIIVSIAVTDIIEGIAKINAEYLTLLIIPLYILFSIGIYFAIGKSKSFKTGYISGFVVGSIWLTKLI